MIAPMKRILALCLTFSLIAGASAQSEIWVSPDGDDSAAGTVEAPLATPRAALRQAREWRRLAATGREIPADISRGINIRLLPGTYFLTEPLLLRPEDSGTESSPTLMAGLGGELEQAAGAAVLSGGCRLTSSWKKAAHVAGLPASARGKVYVTAQPKVGGHYLDFRQLWVNGRKAVRSRSENGESYPRIIAWDKKAQVLTVPAAGLEHFETLDGLEMVLHQMWAIANLRVRNIDIEGDEAKVTFHQPESRIQAEHPWPTPMTAEGLKSPFFLCNAIEFLDTEGEWYLDTDRHLLYYWPRKGENLARAECIVPVLPTLVNVEGSKENPVSHVGFRNITFAHTTWMRPSLEGSVPLQAGMFLLDAYKLRPSGVPGNENKGLENQGWIGRPAAAVALQGVQYTSFENCRFEHLASCGLDYREATFRDRVSRCRFEDIGGNAIQAGRFSDPGIETHLPYDPTDLRELCRGLYIGDCLIHDCTNEDWGCTGICAGYVRDIVIEHNELSELSYTGISLGWGWTKTVNTMRNNRVHANYIHHYAKHMYDVAGIYTLSVQSKSFITENVVDSIYSPAYVHDPHHWFYLYTDEGSSFITVKDNWCPSEKFLQNANGPGNVWENNGPGVSDEIRQRAGVRR